MTPGRRSQFAAVVTASCAALLAACGGGGSDPAPAPGPGPGPTTVTISGAVTFDLVPVVAGSGVGAGLDYDSTVAAPVRGATVEFVEGSSVLASAPTDAAGAYALTVPANRTGFVRVRAEMVLAGVPAWDFRVVDNTNGDAPWVLDGASFSTGTAALVRDLHAPSGWTGAGYGAERAAAPFAILDTVYDAVQLLLDADMALVLPPLDVHWSPDNIPSPASGGIDVETGEIVSTFHAEELGGIYVLGAEDSDTDEYDRHVLLHEFAHYLETAVARSDTIGGPHSLSDALDLRVAFSEGWGNAFAAIAAGDNIYSDVMGPGQGNAPSFDLEGGLPSFLGNPGWFSELTVQEFIYDLFDAEVDGADSLELGFTAIYDVLTGVYSDAVALGSLFTFVDGIKQANAAAAPVIDAMLSGQSVDPVADGYGSGETNDAGSSFPIDVLPVYKDLTVGGPAVNVCSTDEFASASTDLVNKLGTRQFLRFGMPAAGSVDVLVTATAIPGGEYADPDFVVHRDGAVGFSEEYPDAACMDVGAGAWQPADCREAVTLSLEAGEHVLEVYEFSNTQSVSGDPPPIGRTCFDVLVTLQ